jgi:DNA replication protein DnaC
LPFGVHGKILMSRIEWNLFGKIWIRNLEDIDFEVISAAENLNKFQNTRFWKEKSVEDVVTLGQYGTGHTIVSNQKIPP